MNKETAIIVVDNGFSMESIHAAKRIVGVCDLSTGQRVVGDPNVAHDALEAFAGDSLNHGSTVLQRLAELAPDAPFILVRAFAADNACMRTRWSDGKISREGWTEGFRWAVGVARSHGFSSVTNCSFGGYFHAMDGSGWESSQLATEAGVGKKGHIVVAAAGAGDGCSIHASWKTLPGTTTYVDAVQHDTTLYNFWGLGLIGCKNWQLTVLLNGHVVYVFDGQSITPNMWNARQQVTFSVEGCGDVQLQLSRAEFSDHNDEQRFDCWIASDSGAFLNHVDPFLVAEPAVFPHVVAVGLSSGQYSPGQGRRGCKPDILLPGNGPISFRTPEVTAAVAQLLNRNNGELTVDTVLQRLNQRFDR